MINLSALTEKGSSIATLIGNTQMVIGIESMMTVFESHEVEYISDSSYSDNKLMLSYLTIGTVGGKKLYLPNSGVNSEGFAMTANEIIDAINEYII